MPYDTVADIFHTKKLHSKYFLKRTAIKKQPFCGSEPPFAGLRDNVQCSS